MEFTVDENRELADLNKYANYYVLMDYWMNAMEQSKSLKCFFASRGYEKIGIYGAAALGKHLKTQLESEGVYVEFTIDRMIVDKSGKVLKDCADDINTADVVVVTPVYTYEGIRKELSEYLKCDIVSLEEVIMSL